MPVRRDKKRGGYVGQEVAIIDGRKRRVGARARTKVECQARLHRALNPMEEKEETPTFKEWFEGRFWKEWVVAQKNKPSEQESKLSSFRIHLEPYFGRMSLAEIDSAAVAQFKAALVQKKSARGDGTLSDKSINNVLAVLSKVLRYAEEVEVIEKAPRVRLFKVERPEIEVWEYEQYARLLEAARKEGAEWHAAVCLAGEAGLRIGEVRALRWREDVDLVAATITVNQQMRKGKVGTPKGRTRRVIPMTATLEAALKRLSTIREGYVIRQADGKPLSDARSSHATYRICRRAGLPERGWHALRHSFGTHAALLGVNPWSLQRWLGHKRIDETMIYVHFADAHRRPTPPQLVEAAAGEDDPDRRVLVMLGARATIVQPAPASERKEEGLRLVR
jgi:integrase